MGRFPSIRLRCLAVRSKSIGSRYGLPFQLGYGQLVLETVSDLGSGVT